MSEEFEGQLRLPPQSVESEQSILGGLLIDHNAWDKIADQVNASDFYRGDHRIIFEHIARLVESNHPCDAVTVAESLDRSGKLSAVGGLTYLASLAQNVPSSANIKRYAEIVRERSLLRRLAAAAADISELAYSPSSRDPREILDHAERLIFDIAEGSARNQHRGKDMPELLQEVVTEIDERYVSEDPDGITGRRSGFIDLDVKTRGLQPGDLIIVAGRPSMGKTALAMNMAENVAVEEGLPVIVFSMEMPGKDLVYRLISSRGRINADSLLRGKLEEEDWQKLTYAAAKLNGSPMHVDDLAGLTPLELRTRARRFARQHNGKLGLIVVDYIQLMSASVTRKDGNRALELSEISRSLKNLAKELRCPVVALSQLSRNVENRAIKRPMLSDLRESGAIEQDADLVLLLYRDEYYNLDSPDKGLAEVIIGKQRKGPVGVVKLAFQGHYSRFENAMQSDNGVF